MTASRIFFTAVRVLLCGYFYIVDMCMGFRNWFTHLAHGFKMRTQGVLKVLDGFLFRIANRRAAQHIWRICGETRTGGFDYNWISLHVHLSPALGRNLALRHGDFHVCE